ncbi:MAG TPA: DegV family protein [Brevefilum sp.]|nr:DegV family protein [Brevefilum sp.]HOR20131.1 DegV family protein [Brevefilum sp.]HPL70170.1 DegV family protein [Brevefilum sp.]
MSKIAIVTDSTAYLPEEIISTYHINVVPLVVIWGEETFLDNVEMGPEEFYKRLSTAKQMPSTSQPTILAFYDVFKKLHAEGYDILTIVISSALSGTLDSAFQAKKMLPDANIALVDSQSTSLPMAFMVLAAARAAKTGMPLEECVKVVETVRDHTQVFFALDTLEFLHRGGRIGGASRFLGTALKLKPILILEDGKIEALEKVRTSKRAHERLIELVEAEVSNKSPINFLGVVHAAAEETAQELLKVIEQKFEPDELMFATLSPVLGTHTGPGTIGIAYVAGVNHQQVKA